MDMNAPIDPKGLPSYTITVMVNPTAMVKLKTLGDKNGNSVEGEVSLILLSELLRLDHVGE